MAVKVCILTVIFLAFSIIEGRRLPLCSAVLEECDSNYPFYSGMKHGKVFSAQEISEMFLDNTYDVLCREFDEHINCLKRPCLREESYNHTKNVLYEQTKYQFKCVTNFNDADRSRPCEDVFIAQRDGDECVVKHLSTKADEEYACSAEVMQNVLKCVEEALSYIPACDKDSTAYLMKLNKFYLDNYYQCQQH